MALRAALKDRARVVRLEADAKRVEGRTTFHPRRGALVRARLEISESPEDKDAAGELTVDEQPTIMLDRKDEDGAAFFLQPDDKLEVESRDLGEGGKEWHLVAVYQVDGEPKPIRKKRKVIGWQARLTLVTESPATPGRTS